MKHSLRLPQKTTTISHSKQKRYSGGLRHGSSNIHIFSVDLFIHCFQLQSNSSTAPMTAFEGLRLSEKFDANIS